MKPVTLIRSDDDFLAGRALASVRERLEAEGYAAEEIAPKDALALAYALETPSMFDAGRLIVVHDADDLPAATVEVVARWSASKPAGIRLVLVASGGAKLAKTLGANAEAIEIRSPPPWETAGWLVGWVKGLGRKIAPEAAEALVESVGQDLRELASAVEQLCLLTEGTIGGADVARLFQGFESQVWTFVDAVMERNPASALRHLRAQLGQGENAIGLVAALARQMRAIAVVRGNERRPAGFFAKELGMSEGAIKRAFRQARGFDDGEVRRAFRLLADADLALKGGEQGESEPPEIVLELLVAGIAERRPAARRV